MSHRKSQYVQLSDKTLEEGELRTSRELGLLDQGERVSVLGQKVKRDEAGWQFILVFERFDAETITKMKGQAAVQDDFDAAKDCLTKGKNRKAILQDFDAFQVKMKNGAKQFELHELVRDSISRVLSEIGGFTTEIQDTIDGDEAFLKIKLDNMKLAKTLADRYDIHVQVDPEYYEKVDEVRDDPEKDFRQEPGIKKCPTQEQVEGVFVGEKYLPAYTAFTFAKESRGVFGDKDLTHNTIMECAQIRIEELINPDKLVYQKFCKQFFTVHQWDDIQLLHAHGFQNWWKLQTNVGLDMVEMYMGQEVAYFSHWLSYYRFTLTPMAAIALIVLVLRAFHIVDKAQYHLIACGYAVTLIIWSALYSAYYNRGVEAFHERWGTRLKVRKQKVRPQFKVKNRDTPSESLQNGLHWLLVVVFLFEAAYVTGYISRLRADMAENEESTLFGLNHKMSMKLSKILVTVNIKVVAGVWDYLSPWLTSKENHKTVTDEKYARVIKLFIVKAVVYYYPFMYIAFMQKYIEGCNGPCMELLQENLAIFFLTQLATIVGTVIFQVVYAYWTISREISAVKDQEAHKKYTYCELQAKCPPFTEDTDDIMEVVLAMGFLLMFSVALPSMVCLSFVAAYVQRKLIANRMVYVNQRAMRVYQLGIGVWTTIIRVLSLIGVITNLAIACFIYDDTPISEIPLQRRMVLFIFLQNFVIVVRVIIELFINPVPAAITRAREINEIVIEDLAGDVELASGAAAAFATEKCSIPIDRVAK